MLGEGEDRKRILVVDDNTAAAETLADVLEYWGHEVQTAFDAPFAVELAEALQPHVAILDLGMPVVDGWECARRLRALPLQNEVLLIALTGYAGEEYRERSLEAGFNHHLTKPADLAHLRALLAGPGG